MANGSSSDSPLRSTTKHSKYYISGADLFFLVENVHFRVHRYFFERESSYFVSKLAMPASPGRQPQGTQDSNAILLEDLTADHFATFLWVFYNPLYSLYDATVSDWEVILGLSVLWDFPEVKNLAVRELEKKEIPDAKRIKLYHANGVDRDILIPRYAALCEREAHLTLEEANDLGMETVVMVSACREEARASRPASGGKSPLSPTITGAELHQVVRDIFKVAPKPSPENKDKTGDFSTQSAPPTSASDKKTPNDTTTDPLHDTRNEGRNKRGGNKK